MAITFNHGGEEGAMRIRAQDAIREGKTRDEYVAFMFSLRPRLNREKWTARLQEAYDSTLKIMNEPRGTCHICGTEMTGMTYGGSLGDKPFCNGDCSWKVGGRFSSAAEYAAFKAKQEDIEQEERLGKRDAGAGEGTAGS